MYLLRNFQSYKKLYPIKYNSFFPNMRSEFELTANNPFDFTTTLLYSRFDKLQRARFSLRCGVLWGCRCDSVNFSSFVVFSQVSRNTSIWWRVSLVPDDPRQGRFWLFLIFRLSSLDVLGYGSGSFIRERVPFFAVTLFHEFSLKIISWLRILTLIIIIFVETNGYVKFTAIVYLFVYAVLFILVTNEYII